jgi:integrase/recombinase XerD
MGVDTSKHEESLEKGLAEAREKHKAPRGPKARCPDCGSDRVWRNGFRRLPSGEKTQTYICASCYRKFTNPSINSKRKLNGEVADSHNFSEPMDVKDLNSSNGYSTSEDEDLDKGYSRSDRGRGLIMENPPQADKRLARGTPASEELLASFGMWLLKNGRKMETVRDYTFKLKFLMKNANLMDPEEVKEFLARSSLAEGSKNAYATVYSAFLKFVGGSWEKPKYKPIEKMPFIPTEEELDTLIAGSGKRMVALLQLLKETGARIGEALRLKWTDLDFERRVVSITPEKGSKPRILPVSEKLIGMMNMLPKKSEKIFLSNETTVEVDFQRMRKRIAKKLNNPRLMKIMLHSFRHWKATMEYHKTKDIIHVKEMLGHKNIENTMIYINIEKSLFQYKNDEFYFKTASSIEEAGKLIEAGFEYVTTFKEVMLFRKRK